MISLGQNLNRICQEEGYPHQATVYVWFDKYPEFHENYTRARARRADSRSDRIDDICRQVASGELTPEAARILIDAEKWQAGKEQPKRYGDKTLHTGPDGESPAEFTLTLGPKAV